MYELKCYKPNKIKLYLFPHGHVKSDSKTTKKSESKYIKIYIQIFKKENSNKYNPI